MRDYLGRMLATMQGMNQYELALGSHSRSGEQFDIWQAVYGPVGDDGYPQTDLQQGNRRDRSQVAAYWKEHYDLSAILQRDWATLGPKLQRQASHLCGQRRQLLSERRRLPDRRIF